MATIVRTARADEDLIEIWLHVADHDPGAADRVIDTIERRFLQLLVFPLSGVARDDITVGIRHIVCGRFLVFYRVDKTIIEILRVLHGRRNIDQWTFENERTNQVP